MCHISWYKADVDANDYDDDDAVVQKKKQDVSSTASQMHANFYFSANQSLILFNKSQQNDSQFHSIYKNVNEEYSIIKMIIELNKCKKKNCQILNTDFILFT